MCLLSTMLKITAVVLAVTAVLASSESIVTPELKSALATKGTADIFVTMKDSSSRIIQGVNELDYLHGDAKVDHLYSALNDHAARTQAPITNFLTGNSLDYQSFWITNQIYIKGADEALVAELESNFEDIVSSIDEEFFATIDKPTETKLNVVRQEDKLEWGVVKIQAPEAWEHIGGLNKAGEGVVIATVDTGVRGSHEALKDNFFGEYGWFDPSTATPTPTDNNGHGTHTTGIIAGGKGVGVAPKAKWSACRGCASSFCAQSDLLKCGEFFTCPTLADGTNPDCSKRPHVVSNSWGGGRGNTWFNEVIEAWHTAGVIPLFSIGNSGPNCNTANSPGDQNVIGVGSTTIDDEISYFSSVGPTVEKTIKPDISAPGSDVTSAYHTADDDYASFSGTSIACPHSAGAIALLKTRNKNLNFNDAKSLLFDHSDRQLNFTGLICDGVPDNQFPNHVFGHGRINALRSVRAQTLLLTNK